MRPCRWAVRVSRVPGSSRTREEMIAAIWMVKELSRNAGSQAPFGARVFAVRRSGGRHNWLVGASHRGLSKKARDYRLAHRCGPECSFCGQAFTRILQPEFGVFSPAPGVGGAAGAQDSKRADQCVLVWWGVSCNVESLSLSSG